VYQDFCVGLCAEPVSEKYQPLSKLAVIIKLSVENHRYVARFIPNRLVAGLQVNDTEAPHAQRQAWRARFINEKTVVVGTAVPHCSSHRPNSRFRF
jgi:hypothetical protein